MDHRTALLGTLDILTAARRDYQAEVDATRATQLITATVVQNDELLQTLGALVRQLDNAIRELADAIRTCDQKTRLLARTSD